MRVAVVLLFVAACATDDRCGEVATALSTCHGLDETAFLDACRAAPAGEADALADAVLSQPCPTADGKADGLGEWAFVEACRPVMMSAYLVNLARNPHATRLDDDRKRQLRPQFGALVDRIRVHWAATLPDDWPLLHVKDAFMDVGAQTFGSEVFVAASRESVPLSTLVHELTHAQQAERFGGPLVFYAEYCGAFYRAGLRYRDNELEREAYAAE